DAMERFQHRARVLPQGAEPVVQEVRGEQNLVARLVRIGGAQLAPQRLGLGFRAFIIHRLAPAAAAATARNSLASASESRRRAVLRPNCCQCMGHLLIAVASCPGSSCIGHIALPYNFGRSCGSAAAWRQAPGAPHEFARRPSCARREPSTVRRRWVCTSFISLILLFLCKFVNTENSWRRNAGRGPHFLPVPAGAASARCTARPF